MTANSSTTRSAEPDGYVVHLARRAMACEFEICLPAAISGEASGAAMEALDLVNRLESQLSYFRDDSIVSEINRRAADQPVEVEPDIFALLELAMSVHHETGGAYDISASPLWETWGFARREGAIPSDKQIESVLAKVGSQFIELDAAKRTIRFHRPGMSINLGSIGKGYAVDRCGEHLRAAGVPHFLAHGGYSSMLANGNRSGLATSAAGWSVGLRHPLHGDEHFDEIDLLDRALGTTSSQFQSFRHQGRRFGHVIDPRTGWPADGLLSVTVLAPSAAQADALLTAFFVLGREAAVAYCESHRDIAAILVSPIAANGWEVKRIGVCDDKSPAAPPRGAGQ